VLQLLGVSPQAAVWLAAIMARVASQLPTLKECWNWNPHNLVMPADSMLVSSGAVPRSSAPAAVVQELQARLEQWQDSTAMCSLLQQSLLYGAVYAAQDDVFILCGFRALVGAVLRQGLLPMTARTLSISLSITAQDEQLPAAVLLALDVLQRLQQLQAASSNMGLHFCICSRQGPVYK
jgi:hypothetical protein